MSIFEDVLRGEWDAVVEKYRGEDRKLKIGKSGETTMHMAARLNKTEHIRKMLRNIEEDEAFEILSIKDDIGETALHIASQLEDSAICYSIAVKDLRLLSVTNEEGATPLYASVAHGNRDAFFTLDFLVQKSRRESGQAIDYSLYTTNTHSILHIAVFREFFGLAIEIIRLYPDLVNIVDSSGLTPLHALAGKPSAFESTYRRAFVDRIILQYLNIELIVKNERERPAAINPQSLTASARERSIDIENNDLLPQEDLTINHETGNSTSAERESSQRRRHNASPSQHSFGQPGNGNGNGNMLKYISQTLFSILFEMVARLLYVLLFSVKVIPIMAGFSWLNIFHLIQHGSKKINNLRQKKMRWIACLVLLDELVKNSSMYMNDPNHPNHLYKSSPHLQHDGITYESKDEKDDERRKGESTFLLAARLGIVEVADAILCKYPMAAFDLDSRGKNAALIACEQKQAGFFHNMLLRYPNEMTNMLAHFDNQGNSALHLAAKFQHGRIALTPESASLLRAEYTWYKNVKGELSPEYAFLQNLDGQIPDEIFVRTHEELIKSGGEWLLKTSESCSVVSALIATVAFATLAVDAPSDSFDSPTFVGVTLFDFYCFFGLLALCFSIVSLLYFLALRTSSFRVIDFAENLPMRLFLGLMTLLLSMVCILASFCFRHYSVLVNDTMKRISIPIYVVTSIRVLSLATSQLPFYHGPFMLSKLRAPI